MITINDVDSTYLLYLWLPKELTQHHALIAAPSLLNYSGR